MTRNSLFHPSDEEETVSRLKSVVLEDSRRAKTSPRNRLGQEDPSPRISFPVRWAGQEPELTLTLPVSV